VNHNGSMTLAKELVIAAKESGATAAKFQVFTAQELATPHTNPAPYQKKYAGYKSQLEMLEALQLAFDDFAELKEFCEANGISFLASGFSINDLRFLIDIGLATLKVPSGEIDNLPYLRFVAREAKNIILSTGMASLAEVKNALGVIRLAGNDGPDITLLQCTSVYPAKTTDANLLAMVSMGRLFNVAYGYSDHTASLTLPSAAVALGASVVEKHLTLDQRLDGPDHQASLSPEQFREMVNRIREVEMGLGLPEKITTKEELVNKKFVRKSIVASKDIRAGDLFSEDNLTSRRPASGIPVSSWDNVVGLVAPQNFQEGELIWI
jgi:N,N'-diacetyllegionaminate synthase